MATTALNNKKTIFGLDRHGRKGIVKELAFIVIQFFILTGLAGNLAWVNAWVYAGLALIYKIIYITMLITKNPNLLNERGRYVKADTKSFDKAFFGLMIPLNLAQIIVAGLDAGRFGWTHLPAWVNLIGLLSMSAGFVIVLWAMVANTHFEASVRIQKDRHHRVCTSGPYKMIRHPGYMGAILIVFGSPLLLGSGWALVPAALTAILFVARTYLEDQTLQKELPGYPEYSNATRYRLLPYVW